MFSVGVRLGTQKCLHKDFFPLKTSKQQNMYHNAYIKKLYRPLKLNKKCNVSIPRSSISWLAVGKLCLMYDLSCIVQRSALSSIHIGGSAIPLHAGGKWFRGRERYTEGEKWERKERGRKKRSAICCLVCPASECHQWSVFFYYGADAFDTSVILKYIMCRSLSVGWKCVSDSLLQSFIFTHRKTTEK